MKKIEVITLHRVTNFGSLLQTYATQTVLERMGYNVEVIDFVPEGLSFFRAIWPRGSNAWKQAVKIIPLTVANIIQYNMSDSFLRKYIHLTQKRFKNFSELKNDCPEADIYLSGSDQVWNTQNNNKDEDLGAYYLAFTDSREKIAYAGSFGRIELSSEELKRIEPWLKEYKAISVRESHGINILNQIGLYGEHVLDPTMLLSFAEWERLIPKKTRSESRFVFVYNLNRNKLVEKIAKKVAEVKKCKIVNFADTFEFISGANNRMNNTPYDFLYYLSKSCFVVTDSFHGTAFSINFNKQFICVSPPKYSSRLESILGLFNCSTRMVNDLSQVDNLLDTDIDYSIVNRKLQEEREISEQYLKCSLLKKDEELC